ncbi:MAG: hypothetical protein ACR2NX_08715 [Chthoniobacterales bacterium]
MVEVAVRDQSGRLLRGLIAGGRWFVVGEEGYRYSIAVRNRTDLRPEVVLSVDGLDVPDGRSASIRKRGYVIDPRKTLVVEGFDTRNVGVIGVAIFNEQGTDPWTGREVKKRLQAHSFPSRFATPP